MRIFILTILFICFQLCIQAQDTLTLSFCHIHAIENYEISKNKALLDEINQIKLKNLHSNYLPKIDLNAQATYQSDATSIDLSGISTGNSQTDAMIGALSDNLPSADDLLMQYKATVDVSQMIYDGGITKASKAYENIKLEADKQSVESDLYGIKANINSLYFSILLLQEQEKALQITEKEIAKRIENLASGVKNGIVLESDLLNLKAEKLKLEQSIQEVKDNYNTLKQNLLFFIEFQTTTEVTFLHPEITIYDTLKLSRPEQQLFDLQSESLEATKQVIKSSKNPKLVGFGQLGYGKPGINMLSSEMEPYYIVGAKLSWNIWDWNKNKNERQVLSISQQQIQNQKEAFEKSIQLSVNQFKNEIERLEHQIQKDEEIIDLRNQITKVSASQLENGTITSTDYLSVLNAETQARILLETHKIQLIQAKINYITTLGTI